jgi:hypothetical protein
MITSEEVRETTYLIERKINTAPFRISAEYIEDELETFRNYITQQEKVNELLELYRKKDWAVTNHNQKLYAEYYEHIGILESELNDNK